MCNSAPTHSLVIMNFLGSPARISVHLSQICYYRRIITSLASAQAFASEKMPDWIICTQIYENDSEYLTNNKHFYWLTAAFLANLMLIFLFQAIFQKRYQQNGQKDQNGTFAPSITQLINVNRDNYIGICDWFGGAKQFFFQNTWTIREKDLLF